MNKSLKNILEEILDGYYFKGGPLFKLTSKNTLHSSLIGQYPFLKNTELDKSYIDSTIEKISDIYKNLGFKGDLLLVYANVFSPNSKKEASFLKSILINLKRKEEYSYQWFNEDSEEFHKSNRRIYQAEGFIMEELFRKISLTDFMRDYDLASYVYIIDIASKIIFNFYDDRGFI